MCSQNFCLNFNVFFKLSDCNRFSAREHIWLWLPVCVLKPYLALGGVWYLHRVSSCSLCFTQNLRMSTAPRLSSRWVSQSAQYERSRPTQRFSLPSTPLNRMPLFRSMMRRAVRRNLSCRTRPTATGAWTAPSCQSLRRPRRSTPRPSASLGPSASLWVGKPWKSPSGHKLHLISSLIWKTGKNKILPVASPCPSGGGGVLSLSAVRQAGQLHFPLLASPLHLKRWWALAHVGTAHGALATLVIAVDPHMLMLQLILMHGRLETFRHCLMWEALWVSIELCPCESERKRQKWHAVQTMETVQAVAFADDSEQLLILSVIFSLCIQKGKTLGNLLKIQSEKKNYLNFRKIEESEFHSWNLSNPAGEQRQL